MIEPRFLSVEEIEELHSDAIEQFGGVLGVRDQAALESATFQPQNIFYYGGGDVFDLAAGYAFHIAEAQSFFDGNKRAAVAAALIFLELNGVSTNVDSLVLYDAMIAIAEKRMTRTELAGVLQHLYYP